MFDLELNISAWSDFLRSSGQLVEDDIIELENHLRDQIDELLELRLTKEEAFLISVKRLGNVNDISEEYSKVNTEMLWKHLLIDSHNPIVNKQRRRDILVIILFSILAGTLAQIPIIYQLNEITFFKNISFFILPFVALFFVISKRINIKITGIILGIFIFTALIVNIYPTYSPNHTEVLIGIHLPILLWLLTGVVYMGEKWKTSKERMNFIRFTGESIIYGSMMMLGIFILMFFIMFIFDAISVDVSELVGEHIIIYGASAAAMITMYLVETKKSVVENFAPILAKIFSPLFLITMIVFLFAMLFTGNSPFMNREFLIGFDLMLVLVLGLVLYSISARNLYEKRNIYDYLNVTLIVAALLIDSVALSAIIFRLSEYGISPNKLAALGENILLLVNLGGLLWFYLRFLCKKTEFKIIEKWQTSYLIVYAIWMAIVVFLFPIVFGFK